MKIQEFINRLTVYENAPVLIYSNGSESVSYKCFSDLVLSFSDTMRAAANTIQVFECKAGERSIIEFLGMIYAGVVPLILHSRLSDTEKGLVVSKYHNTPISAFPIITEYLTKVPDDNCFILLTSGSNSAPKPVVHSFERAIAAAVRSKEILKLSENDVWFQSLSLAHIGGLMITLRAIVSGSSVVIGSETKVERVAEVVNKFKVTHCSIVPAQLYDWIESGIDLPTSVKTILLGGARARKSTLHQALQKGYPLYGVYGSTETLAFATLYSIQDYPDIDEGAGFPLPGVQVKIRDEKGQIVAYGNGEILVGSETCLIGYLNYPQQFIEGFFTTGDVGIMDEAGFLSKVSRKDDTIISGGENIQPKEIEALLVDFLNCDFCIVGAEHPKWGEEVVLAIEGVSEITYEHIKLFLSNRIASFKIPKRVVFVEQLPRTSKGEIDKKKLRSELALKPNTKI